jgi:hypothetical protein
MRRLNHVGHGSLLFLMLAIVNTVVVSDAWGQTPPRSGESAQKNDLPSDQRLLKLHRVFVTDAEKLASEYERDKDLDKARAVYGEILKLVPKHQLAVAKLQMILEAQANADKQLLSVPADAGWFDTGINVIQGKPVRIRANGTWSFRLTINLTPEGMKIPKELREFNLGALIGAVSQGDQEKLDSFFVGKDLALIPKTSGRLLLRMYDVSPSDNEGEMKVEVRGSFQRARK